jgi:hypothetical protein
MAERCPVKSSCLALCALLTCVAAALAAEPAAAPLAIKAAKLVACDDADHVINDAVIVLRDGQIAALGPAASTPIPPDCRVLEFAEHWVVPGIVEAHNHSTSGGWGDLNDMVYQTNPGLDTRVIPRPDNDWVKLARTGGVTTALLLPGSGTNMSGFGTVVSTGGRNPDEMILRSPGSQKVAQAGNPEWYFGGNGRSFMNWNTRQTLLKAKRYSERWDAYETACAAQRLAAAGAGGPPTPPTPPAFDPHWDKLRGLFHGDYPAAVHTQIYQVQLQTIEMFAKGLGVWTITEHGCFDAWKCGPLVRELEAAQFATDPHPTRGGLWTIQGPRQFHFDRAAARMSGNAVGWWKNGVRKLGINTDAPVIPQEQLTYQAAMACWYGWLPYPALRGITNINAKAIGMYERVGSLEPGKRADVTVWTGDPLDPRSACVLTIINGQIEYDASRGVRRF